jgi:hypothetical protein
VGAPTAKGAFLRTRPLGHRARAGT